MSLEKSARALLAALNSKAKGARKQASIDERAAQLQAILDNTPRGHGAVAQVTGYNPYNPKCGAVVWLKKIDQAKIPGFYIGANLYPCPTVPEGLHLLSPKLTEAQITAALSVPKAPTNGETEPGVDAEVSTLKRQFEAILAAAPPLAQILKSLKK